MKVLVVDPNAARAAGVADAFAGSGATTTVAPSASFALTMLEWNRHDVIISRAQVGDMDAREFCAMVRNDPSTAGVRFVVIASDITPAQMAQHRIDLVIPEGLVGHAIVTRVTHLMRRDPPTPPPPPPTVAPPSEQVTSGPPGSPVTPSSAPPPAPISESIVEPVAPPATELAAEPVAMSAAELEDEPVAAPPSELGAEPAATPAEELPVEQVAAPVVELGEEPIAMPAELEVEPVGHPIVEPVAEAEENLPLAGAPPSAGRPEPEPPPAPSAPAAPSLVDLDAIDVNGATRTFQGALGALAVEELAQALATGGKTGRLLLVLGTGGGMIAFEGGRVVHAEVGNTTGETAFQTLLAAAHRERGGKFCFIPSAPRDLASIPKTIGRSVTDLLVGAAAAMAEER